MKYHLIAARANGKTSAVLKMISRLAEDRCVCCGETIPEGRQVCIKCEKCIDAICKNGSVYPLTATELEIIRMNADITSPDAS